METNKGKTKSFFMCCKPAVVVDDCFKPARRRNGNVTDPVLTYLAVADENGVVLSSALAAVAKGGWRKKGRDRWQALRAVLNETALMKKIVNRRKTNKENFSLSKSNSNLEVEASGKISNPERKTTRRTNSNVSSTLGISSAFTSSSSLSSSCPSHTDHVSGSSSSHETHPTSIPLNGTGVSKQKQNGVEDKRKGYYGSNTALCMLLINLLVLILWGKFPAILCTSIWFYLMSPSRRKPCNEGVLCGKSDFDSVHYKKKIIMEGLLQRSHSRVLPASSSMPKSL